MGILPSDGSRVTTVRGPGMTHPSPEWGWGGEWVGGPMELCWSPERPLVNQRAEGIGDQRCPATEDVAEEDTTEVVVH